MSDTAVPIFAIWERTTGVILDHTARFPRSARFTFAQRIDNAALDIIEALAEACYATARTKGTLLASADRRLHRLRVLLRLAHAQRYLSPGGYEALMRALDETGRMLGGWRRHVAGRAGEGR